MRKILIGLALLLCMNVVYAECNDKELIDYASNLKIEYKDYSRYGLTGDDGEYIWTGELPYAYLLAFSEYREDVYAKTSNSYDDDIYDGEMIPGYKIYAVGCRNNLTEVTYTVNVYGSSSSACPNEIIKSVKIKVPPFNEYSHTDLCDKNPTHELCKLHLDTSDVTYEEFKEKVTLPEEQTGSTVKTIGYIIGAICLVVPLTIIIIHLERKHKKHGRKGGRK